MAGENSAESAKQMQDAHGYWVPAYVVVDMDQERQVNTFFERENAERKIECLVEGWDEHTEDSFEIVEVLVDVS